MIDHKAGRACVRPFDMPPRNIIDLHLRIGPSFGVECRQRAGLLKEPVRELVQRFAAGFHDHVGAGGSFRVEP